MSSKRQAKEPGGYETAYDFRGDGKGLKRLFSVRMSIFEKHKQCLDCP
jgi:hypothetical protein